MRLGGFFLIPHHYYYAEVRCVFLLPVGYFCPSDVARPFRVFARSAFYYVFIYLFIN